MRQVIRILKIMAVMMLMTVIVRIVIMTTTLATILTCILSYEGFLVGVRGPHIIPRCLMYTIPRVRVYILGSRLCRELTAAAKGFLNSIIVSYLNTTTRLDIHCSRTCGSRGTPMYAYARRSCSYIEKAFGCCRRPSTKSPLNS